MQYSSLDQFLSSKPKELAKGPVALILAEDQIEADSTLRHHLNLGFKSVILFARPDIEISAEVTSLISRVDFDALQANALTTVVNRVLEASGPIWIYYCFNSEYLFFPFCETRSVGEMLSFHTEERRASILTYVIDLYAGDLAANPNAVSIDDAYLDRSGYYALARKDRWDNAIERQLDFFGGLRWRFEEHIPAAKRKIDRISLFKNKPKLKLYPDHTLSDQEYNTYSCPWHNNITATICSFRTAKALKRNPGSTYEIDTFKWYNSAQFEWSSSQLLNLGLMEPGQWF